MQDNSKSIMVPILLFILVLAKSRHLASHMITGAIVASSIALVAPLRSIVFTTFGGLNSLLAKSLKQRRLGRKAWQSQASPDLIHKRPNWVLQAGHIDPTGVHLAGEHVLRRTRLLASTLQLANQVERHLDDWETEKIL